MPEWRPVDQHSRRWLIWPALLVVELILIWIYR